jgi:outer membrane protein OmpA-like peptidoglycan-associated protein
MNARIGWICLAAVVVDLVGCATPPKPPELEAFERMRRDAVVAEAAKRNQDLISGADRLLARAREHWNDNELVDARNDSLLGQIKLKHMVALSEQEQARHRTNTADAEIKLLTDERTRLGKELGAISEQVLLLRKLQEATLQLTSEQKRAAATDRIKDAEIAVKNADAVNAPSHAKSVYAQATESLSRARQEFQQENFSGAQGSAETAILRANEAITIAKPHFEQETQSSQNSARAEALARDAASLPLITVRREARGVVQRLVIPIPGERLFNRRETSIATVKEANIDPLAELLKKYPSYPLQIIGHTDNRGRSGEQLAFSLARAESVFSALVLRGVDPKRMTVSGQGSSEPIADNRSPSGRALNNRVEIIFIYQ